MAIIFVDGCDHYTDGTGCSFKYEAINSPGSGLFFDSTGGRFGGRALRFTDGGQIWRTLNNGSPDTLIVQMAIRLFGSSQPNNRMFTFACGAGGHISITSTLDGTVRVYRGDSATGTYLGQTNAGVLSFISYTWLSVKVVIHSSTGSVVIKDSAGSTLLSLTGINTQAYGSPDNVITQLRISNFTSGSGFYVDDIIVMDTTGSSFNDHTTDMRIQTLFPNATGNSSGMTRTGGGSSNYEAVDDTNPDSDTTYVSSASAGTKDTYGMTDLSGSPGTVHAVVASPVWKKTDAGARTASVTIRSGGSDADSSAVSPTTSYTVQQIVMEQNPVTSSAWTAGTVNSMEAGPKVAS